MAYPPPVLGLVIRYTYLWAREHAEGGEEATKDRAAAIVLVGTTTTADHMVPVLPITHTPPGDQPSPWKSRIPSSIGSAWTLRGHGCC